MSNSLHRRHFILAVGSGTALSALPQNVLAEASDNPLPPYASWKDSDTLIVHTNNTIETRRDAFGTSGILPEEDLYVRNNLPAPDPRIVENPDAWEITFEGVRNGRTLKVRELKQLGIHTVAAVLQCSGNGRAFFDHKASGTQWSVGAAGNLLWSGVPLSAVAEALGGVLDGRRFITGTGGETLPQGVDPKTVIVERSIPISAMDRALLAWEVNGNPLSLAHGGPLRLVIPGYYGINNVKYVKKLAFTEQESDAQIQRTGYRVRPVGQKGAPSQPSMWQMNVKSWVTHPLRQIRNGKVQVYGVAFGGESAIKTVEVSTDGGKSWSEARLLGPDMGRFAWRPFAFAAELKAGRYTIASRATDTDGNKQPEMFEPNERGYGHNGWRAHAADVTVT